VADAFIVHEPCVGLHGAIYWRQGVPEAEGLLGRLHVQYPSRPILGTVGFDFPWKNYTLLAQLTAKYGWGLQICVPEITKERQAELEAINPWTQFALNLPTREVIATLAECDATAFLYVCANSGTSAAIRLGIAARKPLIAFSTCRQFRDLLLDPFGSVAISWATTVEEVEIRLRTTNLSRFDTCVTALAEQDSWRHLGRQYANLYRVMATGGRV